MAERQKEFFPDQNVGVSPRIVRRRIAVTQRRLAKSKPQETTEEHEHAENGGTTYWSTWRR